MLCFRYLLERMTEEQILAIDRAHEVANCSITAYQFDPGVGRHGKLVLRRFNYVAPLEEEGAPITEGAGCPGRAKITRCGPRRRCGGVRARAPDSCSCSKSDPLRGVRRRRGPTMSAADIRNGPPSQDHRGEAPVLITPALLRDWPLPQPDEGGDKEERGRVLIVGGSAEMPGAVILAAVAALRAGAGKLRIATCRSVAPWVAVAVPEARVFALPETEAGAIPATAADQVARQAEQVDALLFGPGMIDEPEAAGLVRDVLPKIQRPTVVLDAAALTGLAGAREAIRSLGGRVVLALRTQARWRGCWAWSARRSRGSRQ